MRGSYHLSVNIFNSGDMSRLKEIINLNMPAPEDKKDPVMNFRLKSGRNKVIFELTIDPETDANEKELEDVTRKIVKQAEDEKLKFSSDL